MKKRKIVALVCVATVLLLAVSAFWYVQTKLDKINKVPDTVDVIPPDQEDFETDTSNEPKDIIELKPEEVDWSEIEPFLDDDLLNILLVGQDRREGEGRQRSDSMILCSINPDTKQISMISFLRDLYVQIPGGYSDNRLNAAYVFGGFPLLMDTLHTNFGVSIDGCFEVDFSGFQSVIDILGGVDIEMTSKEARIINIGTETGVYHLDGTKALAYSRIRKIDNDFYRTQRQRNVLQAIYTKFRQSNAADLMKLLDEVLPYLSTDMTNSQIMLLAAKCIPIMGSAELSSYRVPADDAYHYASIRGMSVVVPDLDKIHEDLLNEYLPLNAEKESSE